MLERATTIQPVHRNTETPRTVTTREWAIRTSIEKPIGRRSYRVLTRPRTERITADMEIGAVTEITAVTTTAAMAGMAVITRTTAGMATVVMATAADMATTSTGSRNKM